MSEPPSIWKAIRPLVFAGWAIAAVRLVLDAAAPDLAMYFGIYYAMPVVLLVLSVRRHFDDLRFLRLMLGMLFVAALVWGLTNAVGYTTAQFLGWEHGRFGPDRAPPLEATTGMRIGMGLLTATLTVIAGTVWMCGWAFLLVWIPSALRRKGSSAGASAVS